MSDTNLAPITLAPAKPYEGKAQTSAVGAAVRKMIDAGWAIAPSRWPDDKAQIRVTGRGHTNVAVDGDHVMVQCAMLEFCPGTTGRSFDDVCAALRDAGWLVFRRRESQFSAWLSAEVVGPGPGRWAAGWKAATDAANVRKAAAEAAQLADAARLRALAVEHDITALVGHVSDHADSGEDPVRADDRTDRRADRWRSGVTVRLTPDVVYWWQRCVDLAEFCEAHGRLPSRGDGGMRSRVAVDPVEAALAKWLQN